jgi:hypothetical protein
MQECHCARDTVVKVQARIMLYKEPGEDGCSGRDVDPNREASMA